MAPRRQHVGFYLRELLLWGGFVAFCLSSVAAAPLASTLHAGETAVHQDALTTPFPAILPLNNVVFWQWKQDTSSTAGLLPGRALPSNQSFGAGHVGAVQTDRGSQSLLSWGVRLQI